MKERLINEIVCMIGKLGAETDGLKEKLYILMKDVNITPVETALTVRDDNLNDRLLKRFLGAKIVKGCTSKTISQYDRILRCIMRKFNKPVIDYTPDDIRLYLAYRLTQDKVSKTTILNETRYLRTLFAWLFAEEIIPKDPMTKIDSIKNNKVKKKAFTEIECERIRQAARTSRETAMIEILLSTGCRVSELCMMRIDEIEDNQILVHGKGNKDRVVYLNAKAQLAIENYLKDRKDQNPYIFPCEIWNPAASGKQSKSQNWYKEPKYVGEGMQGKSSVESIVRRIGKRANVENCHPHRFRRTCATFALQRGMPLELVSKMLGHEQLTTTQIYLDLNETELASAHKKYVV